MQIVTAIRGKLDAKPKARMEKLLRRQLFQHLADHRDELLSRVTVLDADLSGPDCGIQADDIPKLARCTGHYPRLSCYVRLILV